MIRISGYSDDVVSIEGVVGEHEIDCFDHEVVIEIGSYAVEFASVGGAIVRMSYHDCWRASVERLNDGVPIPWPIAITGGEQPYSIEVTVDCPDGTPILWDVEEVPRG